MRDYYRNPYEPPKRASFLTRVKRWWKYMTKPQYVEWSNIKGYREPVYPPDWKGGKVQ